MKSRGWTAFFSSEQPEGTATPSRALEALAHDVDLGNSYGLRNMPWKPATDSAISPLVIDVNWLVQQSDLPFLVQALPAQLLHRSLVAHGPDDALEVIEWIRGKQLVRFMDYEMWSHNPETQTEDVSSAVVVQWLRRWLEIGPQFAAERISDFEEESLVVMLTSLLDIQVEGLSRFEAEKNDDYWTTVDGRFHLRVKDSDPLSFEVIKQVIDALYGVDIKWAGSVLSHAAMLVRSESLEDALRWREGRMADAGFVPVSEARGACKPRSLDAIRGEISKAVRLESERKMYAAQVPHDEVDDGEIGPSFSDSDELVNSVHALLQSMEPSLAMRTLESSLGCAGVLQLTEGAQFAPELFVADSDLMEEAISSVLAKVQSLLLRMEAAGQKNFRSHRLFIERVFAEIAENSPQTCSELKARVARVSNMFLSGTSTSSDADAQARALAVVRGCLNIGLEKMVANPVEFNLPQASENIGANVLLVSSGVQAIELVGPEYVFQLGWAILGELALTMAKVFEATATEVAPAMLSQSKIATLAREQRYAELRRELSRVETVFSVPVFHVVESILNRVPLYPEVLDIQSDAIRATANRRAFETLRDVENANVFVSNLPRMEMVR